MSKRLPTSILEVLRAIPALRGQTDRALAELARLVDEVDIAAGTCLTREGLPGREAFIIIGGEVEVFVDGECVATLGPGAFVGEMAMLERLPRTATVRTRTPVHALVVGPSAFESVVHHPGVAAALARQLSDRLRRADADR